VSNTEAYRLAHTLTRAWPGGWSTMDFAKPYRVSEHLAASTLRGLEVHGLVERVQAKPPRWRATGPSDGTDTVMGAPVQARRGGAS